MSAPVQFQENSVCGGCGQFGAFEFNGVNLCGDCYGESGSCCPGLRQDDGPGPPEKITPQG